MSHRDSKKSLRTRGVRPLAPKGAAVEPPPHVLVENRRRHLRKHYWLGVLILILFTLAKYFIRETPQGHWLHLQAYQWLHEIARAHSNKDLPVVLVDISDMKRAGPAGRDFTPRADLQGLVQKLAEAGPDAIGVDIDLSPEADGFVATNSFKLFDSCLELSRRGTPVFLGVHRMAGFGPATWLGSQKYSSLAANVSRPRGMVLKMNYEYEFEDKAAGQTNRLVSLSQALASAYAQRHDLDPKPDLPRPFNWFTRRIAETVPFPHIAGFKAKEFFVDYSRRREIERAIQRSETIRASASGEWAAKVRGRVVLIGDALPGETQDTAIIPGAEEPVPGVQVQACAIYTLARSPVIELEWWAGLGLSFLVALAALRLIHHVCWKYSQRLEVSAVALNILLTVVLVVVVSAVAWLLMRVFQVVWLEIFAVVAVLVVHCWVEIFVAAVDWRKVKRGWSGIGEALVSIPGGKE